MGLHAAIIRLSPLIHEREQRYKPNIVDIVDMTIWWVASVIPPPPLKNPGYAPEHLTSFWTRWRWLPTQLSWIFFLGDFFAGINTGALIGAREITHIVDSPSLSLKCPWRGSHKAEKFACSFWVKFFQWHRRGEREWYSNRIRLHPGKEKKRREALWTGSHNPERLVSWWRCARYKIRGDRE